MKLIITFVPNHSSNEHEWFIKSEQKVEPYTDYYIWSKAKEFNDEGPIPPNNWVKFL